METWIWMKNWSVACRYRRQSVPDWRGEMTRRRWKQQPVNEPSFLGYPAAATHLTCAPPPRLLLLSCCAYTYVSCAYTQALLSSPHLDPIVRDRWRSTIVTFLTIARQDKIFTLDRCTPWLYQKQKQQKRWQ